LFAQRVHDILTLVSFARSEQCGAERVYLAGVNGAGPWVAAARALASSDVDGVAIDTGGFRFANLESYRDVDFLPGSVNYGDLQALLALSAPHRLWICGETDLSLRLVTAAYAASGKPQNLTIEGQERRDVFRGIAQLLNQSEGGTRRF
ncbi:MAG: hypothetical protein JSW47_17785, partial [Phycisphaerales bacterium]